MSLASVKKGETVVLLGFTGIRLADVIVTEASKTELKVEKKDGAVLVFDRKTGIQKNVEAGKEKYANKLVTVDEAPAPKEKKKPAKKQEAPKKPTKKAAEPEEEDETPAPKKTKKEDKKGSKKPAPKKPAVEEDDDWDEDDEDEYEEL